MKRRVFITAMVLALAALGALSLAGCGSKEAQAQACSTCGMQVAADKAHTVDGKLYCERCVPEPAAPAETAAPAEPAATEQAAAVHDCAGGCGMTAVPEDQLTEIDGKWYCAGCAKKTADDGHGHDHG